MSARIEPAISQECVPIANITHKQPRKTCAIVQKPKRYRPPWITRIPVTSSLATSNSKSVGSTMPVFSEPDVGRASAIDVDVGVASPHPQSYSSSSFEQSNISFPSRALTSLCNAHSLLRILFQRPFRDRKKESETTRTIDSRRDATPSA